MGNVLRALALFVALMMLGALSYGLFIAAAAITMDHFEPGRHAYHMCLLQHRGEFDDFIARACRGRP